MSNPTSSSSKSKKVSDVHLYLVGEVMGAAEVKVSRAASRRLRVCVVLLCEVLHRLLGDCP